MTSETPQSKDEQAYQFVMDAIRDCIKYHGQPLQGKALEAVTKLEELGAIPSVNFLKRIHERGYY